MEKIDLKYRIPLVGNYNKRVYVCPNCNEELLWGNKHGSLFDNIIGFASAPIGEVAIIECPECFTKWYYHSRIEEGSGSHYTYFQYSIKDGTQKHFK